MSRSPAFETLDDWNEYVTYARALEAEPETFQTKPLKIKLAYMTATLNYEPLNGFATNTESAAIGKRLDHKKRVASVSYREEMSGREWFRDKGDVVKWKGMGRNDHGPMRQLLRLSREKWPDRALSISGTRAFRRAAYAIAFEEGFEIEGPEFELYKKHRMLDYKITMTDKHDLANGISQPRRSPALSL
jgi:hypothetical protein